MASEATNVDTSLFIRHGKVKVDGMLWSVNLPSAKTTIQLSKNKRRARILEKKVEADTATEADAYELDDIEDFFFDTLKNLFRDGSKDNAEVNRWIDETPMYIVLAVFEDIQQQAERKRD